MLPTLSTTLPGGSESEGNVEDFNLEDLLEFGPEVNCFLQGPVESSERRM